MFKYKSFKSVNISKLNNVIVKTGIFITLAILSYSRINQEISVTANTKSSNKSAIYTSDTKTVFSGTHFNVYNKNSDATLTSRN